MKNRSLRRASMILSVFILGFHHEGWSRSYETQNYITCYEKSKTAQECLDCTHLKTEKLKSISNSQKNVELKNAFNIRKNHLKELFGGFWTSHCISYGEFQDTLNGHLYNACAYTKFNTEWEYMSCYEKFCEDDNQNNSNACLVLNQNQKSSRPITDSCMSTMKANLNLLDLKNDYKNELKKCENL